MKMSDVKYRLNYFKTGVTQDYVITNESINDDEHLTMELLQDVNDFIKKNPSTKEVTSPVFFSRPGQNNPEGLLSNEIFGLTKSERAEIWGYIDLHDHFIHPLIYKKLFRTERKFRDIVHGTKKFTISSSGELVEDENGNTGIKWLKANFDSIKIKQTESLKRENVLNFIKTNRDVMFMNKMLVEPAYYRDVNTQQSGKVAVGEINELYASLIIAVRGIKESAEYGFDLSDAVRGRIQEIILAIYDWYMGNNNEGIEGSTGLSKKTGIIRRTGMSKTSDYGSRLVLSAPELKVQGVNDMMVDIKHSAVPLASVCANFFPFMLYHIRRFFENEFETGTDYPVLNKKGEIIYHRVDEPLLHFSDERIKEELHRFIHGYSNRFIPVEVPIKEVKTPVYMAFKGRLREDSDETIKSDLLGDSGLVHRKLTWCDIFYIAACECVKGKTVLITRYPIDSSYNQFPSLIRVSSTIEMEPIYYENEFYKYYPKIRDEDIGSNTASSFVDTLNISNLMLKAIDGDYDGDTTSQKGVYTQEANEELINYINSKANYIGFGGKCIRATTNESIQSIFNLTRVIGNPKLDDVEF